VATSELLVKKVKRPLQTAEEKERIKKERRALAGMSRQGRILRGRAKKHDDIHREDFKYQVAFDGAAEVEQFICSTSIVCELVVETELNKR
jgi:hypothetical protein